jgi:hypothetical protein
MFATWSITARWLLNCMHRAIPQSMIAIELSSMFQSNGGSVAWIRFALGMQSLFVATNPSVINRRLLWLDGQLESNTHVAGLFATISMMNADW